MGEKIYCYGTFYILVLTIKIKTVPLQYWTWHLFSDYIKNRQEKAGRERERERESECDNWDGDRENRDKIEKRDDKKD